MPPFPRASVSADTESKSTQSSIPQPQPQPQTQPRAEAYPHASRVEPPSSPLTSTLAALSAALATAQVSTSNFLHTADPRTIAAVSAIGATGLTLTGVAGYRRWWRRIRNADSITTAMLEKKPVVRGVVTRVGDGDGFRLYHTPGPFWRYPFKLRRVPSTPKALKNETLSIRIAGVDAPELAHFGNPAQPHAKEALVWLTDTVLGKVVQCQLLRKDQYGRIVGVPYLPRRVLPNRPLPLMMLREGHAVVYTQGGSEYGPWGLEAMQKVEDEARRARRGLWSARKVELPGDFKKRAREGDTEAKEVKMGQPDAWWERMGRWLGGKT